MPAPVHALCHPASWTALSRAAGAQLLCRLPAVPTAACLSNLLPCCLEACVTQGLWLLPPDPLPPTACTHAQLMACRSPHDHHRSLPPALLLISSPLTHKPAHTLWRSPLSSLHVATPATARLCTLDPCSADLLLACVPVICQPAHPAPQSFLLSPPSHRLWLACALLTPPAYAGCSPAQQLVPIL